MAEFHYTKTGTGSPIPIVSVYLQNPINHILSTTFNCAILDTGSDITVVSYDIISRLQLRSIDSQKPIPFRGLGGETHGVPFLLELGFDSQNHIKSRVIAVPDDVLKGELIIGRNILNRYLITFNWPKLVFKIE
jgi:hypothetical protein